MSPVLKNCRGQSMVEFALILPILILILMAILEFGFIFKTYIQLSYGATEISRAVSLGATAGEVSTLSSSLFSDLKAASLSTSITPSTAVKGQSITVVVSYTHTLMTPIIGNIVGNTIVIKGKSVVIKE